MLSSFCIVAVLHINAVGIQSQKGISLSKQSSWSNRQSVLAASVLFSNFVFLILLFLRPFTFSTLAFEGSLVETLSALFFFIGSAMLGIRFCELTRQHFPNKLLVMVGLFLLALVFFVIAMEEVSWFQRVLEFETPDAFSGNLQGEFNFHNFATKMFENAFYTGAFICLICLPFLYALSVIPERLKGLEVFLGSSFTLCVSSLFVAYNYHYWNSFSTQIPFFLTLLMLGSLCVLSRPEKSKAAYMAFICMLLVTQIAFFLQGHSMRRLWDATEYKEFFIALGFLIYAFDVRRNLLRHVAKPSEQL